MKPRAINLEALLNPVQAGCTATFKLSKPDSTSVSKTLLTDPQGKAVAQFSLGSRYPHGTYVGKVVIAVSGKTITASQSVVL